MTTGEQHNLTRDEDRREARCGIETENIDMETSVRLDFLGDLRRTHTCGATARRRCGQDACFSWAGCTAAAIMAA